MIQLVSALIIAGVGGEPAKEENMNAHVVPRNGRVVILSSVDMIKNAFVLSQADPVSNLHFFADLVEVLTADPMLLQIGAEQDQSRRLDLFKALINHAPGNTMVRYYASGDMPQRFKDLRTQTLAVLEEMKSISGGRVLWEVLDPKSQAFEFAERKVKEYLETKAKGLTPKEPAGKLNIEELFSGKKRKSDPEIAEERRKKAEVNARASGRSSEDCFRELLREEFKQSFLGDLESRRIGEIPMQVPEGGRRVRYKVFSSLEIVWEGKEPEVIPMLLRVQGMDYEVARCILKLARTAKPKVMFFDGRRGIPNPPSSPGASASLRDPDGFMAVQGLAAFFEVEEVVLKEGTSLDEVLWTRTVAGKEAKASCFIVLQPEDLEERQVYEISRAVSEGIPTIFFVSRWSMDVSEKGREGGYPLRAIHPGLDEMFRTWGIILGTNILASRECWVAPEQRAAAAGPLGAASPRLPVLLKTMAPSLKGQHPGDSVLQFLLFPATVGLDIDPDKVKAAGLRLTELVNSGAYSYPVALPPAKDGTLSAVMKIKALSDTNTDKAGITEPRPLAVLIEGKFPFPFEGRPVPSWKKAQ